MDPNGPLYAATPSFRRGGIERTTFSPRSPSTIAAQVATLVPGRENAAWRARPIPCVAPGGPVGRSWASKALRRGLKGERGDGLPGTVADDYVPPRSLPRVRRERAPGQKRKGAQTSEKNRKYDITSLENIG